MKAIRTENAEKILAKAKSLKAEHKELEGSGEPASFTLQKNSEVGFADIACLDEVKEEISNCAK